MISLPVIAQVVSGPIVWRKLVVALRLRFSTIKQDYEGMDAGEGHSPSVSPLSMDVKLSLIAKQTLPRRRGHQATSSLKILSQSVRV
jgi:hypothetical protein